MKPLLLSFATALLILTHVSHSEAKTKSKSKPSANPQCTAAYNEIFSKPIVNISVIFGYKDTRPARFVGDRHEKLSFVQKILKPCRAKQQACGFERSPKNADLFFKTMTAGKNSTVIQMRVVHSSVGSDDQSNRVDPYQAWQSEYANESFLGGMRDSDVVFYNGHSRFGGGPDFAPPQLDEKNEVDAPYYKNQKPGFVKLLDIIQVQSFTKGAVGGKMKVFGLFSCGSSQHFTEEIQQYSGVGLIASKNLIYYADALDNSLIALSSFLKRRCLKQFNASLHNGNSVKGMRLQGFLSK